MSHQKRRNIIDFIKENVFSAYSFVFFLALAYFEGFYDWTSPYISFEIKDKAYGVINQTWTFFTIAIFYITFAIFNGYLKFQKQQRFKLIKLDNERLQGENDELVQRLMSYFDPIIRDTIQSLYEQLDFTEEERITVYKVENDYFWPIARVSENADYREYRRDKYHKNQGCIGIAWKQKYKDYNRAPENAENWAKKQEEKWQIPSEEAINIRMKSRSLFAARVDEIANNKDPLAIIVFESERPQTISKKKIEKIKEILENEHVDLESKLKDYHEYGPSKKMPDGEINEQ